MLWSFIPPPAGTPLFTLKGKVTDVSTGDPIAGVAVSANPTVPQRMMAPPSVTGENGSYKILVKSGTYTLKVVMEGFEAQEESIAIDKDDVTVDVTLKPASLAPISGGATITGKVSDSKTGLPIKGALVKANNLRAKTAQDGSYSLSIAKGSYALTVSVEGFKAEAVHVDVSEETRYAVDVSMTSIPIIKVNVDPDRIFTKYDPTATITALVKKSDGTPAAGVTVDFDISNELGGEDDLGKLDSKTGVTDNAGVVTAKWTCITDLHTPGTEAVTYVLIITVSANIEDQIIQGSNVLIFAFAPCSDCHTDMTGRFT